MENWHKALIKSLINDISSEDNLSESDFFGCTEAQLNHIMEVFQVKRLPEIYRQFMLQMGRGFKSRDDDMMWTYPKILEFEDHILKLDQENIIVFMWHNIHQVIFYCFSTADESDNPPVMMWNEDMPDVQLKTCSESLSQFLINFFAPH